MSALRKSSVRYIRRYLALLGVFALVLVFSTALPASASAQGKKKARAKKTKIVVMKAPGDNAPNLNKPIIKLIELPLRRKARILAPKIVNRAARQLNLKGKAKNTANGTLAVGKALKAQYGVFLTSGRAVAEGEAKPVYSLLIKVFHIKSGRPTLDTAIVLPRARLSPKIAQSALRAIKGAFAPPAEPEVAPEPVTEVQAEPEVPLPPPLPVEPAPEPVVEEPPPVPEVVAEVVPEVVPEPEPELVEAPPEAVVLEAPVEDDLRARPFLYTRAGVRLMWRLAGVSDASPLEDATYGGSAPLVGGHLEAEFYPLAIGGTGKWFEGFGLHLGASYASATTVNPGPLQDDPADDITSVDNVLEAYGGLSYRLVLWNSRTAADFTFDVGYQYDQFPLKGVGFPGVIYDGVYVGGIFSIPLGVEWFRLEAGGRFQAWIRSRGDLERLGQSPSALAFDTTLGIKVEWKLLEFGLAGYFQQRNTDFTGTSTLTGLAAFNDANFIDRKFGADVTVGIRLPSLGAKKKDKK